jgi:hypothetical protein
MEIARFCVSSLAGRDEQAGSTRPMTLLAPRKQAKRSGALAAARRVLGSEATQDYFSFRHLEQDLRPLGAARTFEVEFGV